MLLTLKVNVDTVEAVGRDELGEALSDRDGVLLLGDDLVYMSVWFRAP